MVRCRGDEAQTSTSSANMDEEFWAANTWQVHLPPCHIGKWATTMTHNCSAATSCFHPTCHFNSSHTVLYLCVGGSLEYKKGPCVWNQQKPACSCDGINLYDAHPDRCVEVSYRCLENPGTPHHEAKNFVVSNW